MQRTTDSHSLPERGYSSPGYIDVLDPTPPPNAINESVSKGGDVGLRRPLVATPSYPIERCDQERWIQIMPPATAAAGGANIILPRKRKRSCPQNEEQCVEEEVDGDSCNSSNYFRHKRKASWDAFRPYLERFVPVKIHNVSLFRDISPANDSLNEYDSGNQHETNSTDGTSNSNKRGRGDAKNDMSLNDVPVLSTGIAALPADVLDTTVTVQCAFPPEFFQKDNESTRLPLTPQEIDRAISFSDNDVPIGNISMFMGQEDQITTEMTLREAIILNESISDTSKSDSTSPSMAVCVAQEPILTTDNSLSISNHDEAGKMQQHDSISDHPDGQCIKSIQILLDGKVTQSSADCNNTDGTPMQQLSSMLRLPSYLLLGDPNETSSDVNNGKILIRNINLWHAPQTCSTNVHYDDHDNLLLVTEGVKTVELCPPGCIRGSGIYSEHANHPALLRSVPINKEVGEEGISRDERIRSEIATTRELKQQRTHIVSIRAGEALYIPSGWWHRVESTPSTNNQSSEGCTAINVWFDYNHTSRVNVPRHIEPFQLRNVARKYYGRHAEHASNVALEKKRKAAMLVNRKEVSVEPTCSIFLTDRWKLLDGTDFCDFASPDDVQNFGQAFSECWQHFMEDVESSKDSESCLRRLRSEMEYLFFFLNLSDTHSVKGLVCMWTQFPLPTIPAAGHMQDKNQLFAKLILGLSPESCFVITQAWERHASSFASSKEASLEVESSYKQFFQLAGEQNEKHVRSHLLSSVEEFRCKTCQSYLMDGIMLGAI